MERVRLGEELGELVEAARAGDRVAFERLIERDAPVGYRAALAVLRSPHDAEDVVQEAALRAWERIHQLRSPAGWSGWFRRIVIHAAVDQARRGYRAREQILAPDDQLAADPGPDADERLTLLGAVSRMSIDDRAILGLRYAADLQVADVADAMGIPLGTAKARLHRAMARLRMALQDPGEVDGS